MTRSEPSCGGSQRVASISGSVDWNCDGDATDTGVRANITGYGQQVQNNYSATFDVLTGFNDWVNLDYDFVCAPGFSALAGSTVFENDLNTEDLTQQGLLLPMRSVAIDLVPQCAANPILLEGPGSVSVVIFSEPDFDATSIVPTSLVLANAGPLATHIADADADGDSDLVADFDMAALFLGPSSTQATLYASSTSGQSLYGQAPVTIVSSLEDNDADGVVNPCDLCENTPRGLEVMADGCPSSQ